VDWDDNLPDVSKWQPRNAQEKLRSLFYERCRQIESRILLRATAETTGCVDSFDSGIGIEDIVREELATLLPSRYSVRAGTIDDRYGKTSGDCDVVVFNQVWFPVVRSGATSQSRKVHFPIEGVYAVGEIKRTLDFKTLDEALEKLVSTHRLHRPTTPSNRVVENRSLDGCPHCDVGNPLYSAVIGIRLAPQVTFEELVNRFFAISKTLPRTDVVRSLCVIGQGALTWGFHADGEVKSATFAQDYDIPLVPIYHRAEAIGSGLYPVVVDLLQNLNRMILSPEDLAVKYGLGSHRISAPQSNEVILPPSGQPQVSDPEDPKSPWNRSRKSRTRF
jgi:hypothetical protein